MSLALTEELYRIISPLIAACGRPINPDHLPRPRLTHPGLYICFEKGETVALDGVTVDRVVRIGISGSVYRRICDHYRRHRRSMFKWHVSCALLYKRNPLEPLLATERPYLAAEFEESLIQWMCQQFTFVPVAIEQDNHLSYLEERLIARLAQFPLGRPTDCWLGHHAIELYHEGTAWAGPRLNTAINGSGLWNVNYVDGTPANGADLELFKQYVDQTIRSRWQ